MASSLTAICNAQEQALAARASGVQKTRPRNKPMYIPRHARQMGDWDCGVACITGAISEVSDTKKISLAEAMKFLPPKAAETRSVWTVDLAYAIKNSGFSNFLCTTTSCGVDPSHAELGFYSKGFDEDEKRVNALLHDAAEKKIAIREESVSDRDLCKFLAVPGNMVIALVNSTDMRCSECAHFGGQMFSCIARWMYGGYVGHYVLLFDYTESGQIWYHDPGRSHSGCSINVEMFEQARKARGTDEDLIFISSDLSLPPISPFAEELNGPVSGSGPDNATDLAVDHDVNSTAVRPSGEFKQQRTPAESDVPPAADPHSEKPGNE